MDNQLVKIVNESSLNKEQKEKILNSELKYLHFAFTDNNMIYKASIIDNKIVFRARICETFRNMTFISGYKQKTYTFEHFIKLIIENKIKYE